ncbi:MAG: cyclic-di-AMP receptor [Anaerolineaceae bacterium]
MTEPETQAKILFIAVIQAQDGDLLEAALDEIKLTYSRLPSVGGFLRERNATFLIGCEQDRQEAVKDLLISTCKKRITFIATPVESAPISISYPSETIVGGISLFSLDLDSYEEIQK